MMNSLSPLEQLEARTVISASSNLSPDEKNLFQQILSEDLSYVDHDEFHKSNPHFRLFKTEIDMSDAELIWHNILISYSYPDIARNNKKDRNKFILSRSEERIVFLQMNYAKSIVYRLKEKYKSGKKLSTDEMRRMFIWYQIAKQRQNTLVVANMGLITKIGKRNKVFERFDKDDILDAMYEGLLKAVDRFNVKYGFKFSTYAWRAISQHMAREMKKTKKRQDHMVESDFEEGFDPASTSDHENNIDKQEFVSMIRRLFEENGAELDEREYKIITLRFGLNGGDPLTLDQVSSIVGVTRERVRQLQHSALEKLNEHFSELPKDSLN